MKERFLWPAIAFLGMCVVIMTYQADMTARGLKRVEAAMRRTEERAPAQIDSIVDLTLQRHFQHRASDALEDFEARLDSLDSAIRTKSDRLAAIQESARRVAQGLPELVELDRLREHYAEKAKSKQTWVLEEFKTSHGKLQFMVSDLTTAEVPSTGQLAWLRIGKSGSTENDVLIKAWIDEATAAKVRLGYGQVYKRTRDNDYGATTEALYRRGDLYFKTSFQYQRMLETYNRYSLKYTYYVEQGSESRKKAYDLEQYNAKLGS